MNEMQWAIVADEYSSKCTRCCGEYVDLEEEYGEVVLRCAKCRQEVFDEDLIPDHESWQCEECGKWCGFGDGFDVEVGGEEKGLCHSCIEKLEKGVSEDAGLRKSA